MLSNVRISNVFHCFDSYAIGLVVNVNAQDVWVVYSGDTRPCPKMWNNLKHSPAPAMYSVLIHEATFDDSMKDEALKKRHSTISEAMEAATAMHSEVVILTHFSQRYPKLPVFKTGDDEAKFLVAFDGMTIPLYEDKSQYQVAIKALNRFLQEYELSKENN